LDIFYISQNIKYDLRFHKFLRVKTRLFTQFFTLPTRNQESHLNVPNKRTPWRTYSVTGWVPVSYIVACA